MEQEQYRYELDANEEVLFPNGRVLVRVTDKLLCNPGNGLPAQHNATLTHHVWEAIRERIERSADKERDARRERLRKANADEALCQQLTAYVEAGIMTPNEARRKLGLPLMPYRGDVLRGVDCDTISTAQAITGAETLRRLDEAIKEKRASKCTNQQ